MLVIHGVWAYSALYMWAEDSGMPAQAPPRPGRPSRAPREHPFAVAAWQVADALPEIAGKSVDDELTLRLPASGDAPFPSPELGREPPAGRPSLTPWRVPAVVFDAADAAALLAALEAPDQVRTRGATVTYLAAVARFAADLVSRGRVLPVLAAEEDGYTARWRPVLAAADAQRARELATAMPPLLRAAEDTPPGPLLAELLDILADAETRNQLPGALLPPRRGRRPTPIPYPERMIAALTSSSPLIASETPQDDAEAAALADSLAEWLATARLPAGPVRTCFRLVEPPAGPAPETPAAPAPGTAQVPGTVAAPASRSGVTRDADVGPASQRGVDSGPAPGAVARDADPGPASEAEADSSPAPAHSPLPGSHPQPSPHPQSPSQADSGNGMAGAKTAPPIPEISGNDQWRVEFALQSAEDPSLMLSAEDVWAGAGGGWLSADVYPEEALLAGLGAAARLFPELNEALREAAPAEVLLDTPGAVAFLSETGPLLAGAGFGVLLPDWARKARLGLRLTTRSASSGASSGREAAFGLSDIVEFRYDLAVGDQVLTAEELAELAAMKVPLVRVRGQWVELDDRHLKAALKFLRRQQSGTMTAGEALLAGTRADAAGELPLTSVDADGWLGDLLSGQADRQLAPLAAPEGFSGELRPYQERGLAWLSFLGSLGLGAILADDMGLGKTVQLLALLASTAPHPAPAPHPPIAAHPSAAPLAPIAPASTAGHRWPVDTPIAVAAGHPSHSGAPATADNSNKELRVHAPDNSNKNSRGAGGVASAASHAADERPGDTPIAVAMGHSHGSEEGAGERRSPRDDEARGSGADPAGNAEATGSRADPFEGEDRGRGSSADRPSTEDAWGSRADAIGGDAGTGESRGDPIGGEDGGRGSRGYPFRRNLLICPMSLVGNWQREAARFTPGLRVYVHHGTGRRAGDEFATEVAGADLVITTYQTATRDREALASVPWARVVCDEAQAIKNHATAQARAIRSLPAEARIALTGTPVENQLSELWSIMEFVNPGLLGPAASFREHYAVPVERHGSEEAADRLRRITQPFLLRRLKTDKSIISDLPDKQEINVWCNLTQEQASLYQATVDDMLARIDAAEEDIQRRGLVLATMAKLKQVCNHPAHLLGDGSRLPGRSGKLERLEEICEEIAADGDKALLFTQYAEWGRMLQPYLASRIGCTVLFLHGGTTKRQRDHMVSRFQEADEPVLFLLSLKAGGTGLNLTAASHVIHVDRWWNPAVEEQATDRAFRIGQRRDVQVRKFICVGTLEEKIDAMISAKRELASQIVGTGENWLANLSTTELREVVSLSSEATA